MGPVSIAINSKYRMLIDPEDVVDVICHHWMVNNHGKIVYAVRHEIVDSKRVAIYLHQHLTGKKMVDHKNGDGLDNTRQNLRPCTHSQNLAWQQDRPRKSPFRGVNQLPGGRWRAAIRQNEKSIYLGSFDRAIDAAIVWNEAALKKYGEFARLNQVGGV